MGIQAKYRRISEEELRRLEADKKYAARFFGTGVGQIISAALSGFKQMLQRSDAGPPRDALAEDERLLDIDKDWQAIHFLLTGEFSFAGESKITPPLSNVVMGGVETKWESTYGKVRLLSRQEVQDVAEALNTISRSSLEMRLDPTGFNQHEVYPAYDRWDAEDLQPLLDVFERIKAFFSEAAAQRNLVLISFD
jgi:hypothetical protein